MLGGVPQEGGRCQSDQGPAAPVCGHQGSRGCIANGYSRGAQAVSQGMHTNHDDDDDDALISWLSVGFLSGC